MLFSGSARMGFILNLTGRGIESNFRMEEQTYHYIPYKLPSIYPTTPTFAEVSAGNATIN
jgi:hypothetical protein